MAIARMAVGHRFFVKLSCRPSREVLLARLKSAQRISRGALGRGTLFTMYYFGALALLLAGFVVFVASRPSAVRYTRSRSLSARREDVFALINDFRQWAAWSPWEKLDPSMVRRYDGPESGPGATYYWIGDKKVGEGLMTIGEADAPSKVVIDLHFLKPFNSRMLTTFTLVEDGGRTLITWTMEGHNSFVSKAFCVFVDMDKMIGKDFEKGLASMEETLAERRASSPEERLAA